MTLDLQLVCRISRESRASHALHEARSPSLLQTSRQTRRESAEKRSFLFFSSPPSSFLHFRSNVIHDLILLDRSSALEQLRCRKVIMNLSCARCQVMQRFILSEYTRYTIGDCIANQLIEINQYLSNIICNYCQF